jgi:hypothetical protein
VQGTIAALLASVVGSRRESQKAKHLSDGDGGPHGGEVDRGAGGIPACL